MDQPLPVPGMDPSRVATRAEFAACLDGLRRRRGLSYEAMERTAREMMSRPGGSRWQPLGKSTVGELFMQLGVPLLGQVPLEPAVARIRAVFVA